MRKPDRHRHYQWWIDSIDYQGYPDHHGPYTSHQEAQKALDEVFENSGAVQAVICRGDDPRAFGSGIHVD